MNEQISKRDKKSKKNNLLKKSLPYLLALKKYQK